MTVNFVQFIFAAVAGFAIGLVFFGGLWLTVQRITTSRRPALLLAGSWVVRTTILISGLWLTTAGQWRRVAVCLAGILLARVVITHRLKPHATPSHGGCGR